MEYLASKSSCESMHDTRLCEIRVAQYVMYILLSSWVSVGWSKSTNVYFQSHDMYVRHALYLVLLYSNIAFKLTDVCIIESVDSISRDEQDSP